MDCLKCGKEFEAKRITKRYCSGACRIAHLRNVSVTQASEPVTQDVTLRTFKPNWQTLAERYPKHKHFKSIENAHEFILGSLMKNHPTQVFMFGGQMHTAHKEALGGNRPEHLDDIEL